MANNNKSSPQSSCACFGQPVRSPLPWLTAALLFWPIAIGGAILDLWSKSVVFAWLKNPEQAYPIINGFLQFILRENSGAAFSAFQGWTKFLIVISCVALIVVVGLFFSRKVTCKLTLIAMGCITAGIIGNFYDRLFNAGRVRDFIDVFVGSYHWPTFNVADSLLCIGVGLLVIINIRASASQTPAPQQKEEP